MVEGEDLRFKGTWMRLTRRAVRDYNFRGTGVAETLDMWANVRRGEKLYISPFKQRANYIFDSSLPYEVSVMKNYAMPLLEAVPQETSPLLLEKAAAAGVTREVELAESINAPVIQGQTLGSITLKNGDEVLGRVPLVAGAAVARLSWSQLMGHLMQRLWMGA